ncbi:MAG TPA: hypothetical protein ENN61_02070 [Bacteroidaceae bacterium]|nr:hypothetical protein [Bacteroidaceae bacterium]
MSELNKHMAIPDEIVIAKIYVIRGKGKEFENLRCRIVTFGWESSGYLSVAFTEQGVAMRSVVFNSKHTIYDILFNFWDYNFEIVV